MDFRHLCVTTEFPKWIITRAVFLVIIKANKSGINVVYHLITVILG